MTLKLRAGYPQPLGATFDEAGVNFAIFSAHAENVELCLFSEDGTHEIARHMLPQRTDDIWHGYLPDASPGLLYGYRVHGAYDPQNGHRFNPHKLLIDPYARSLDRPFEWNDLHCGYVVGDAREDLSFDTRDNAPLMPKSRVLANDSDLDDVRPQKPFDRSVIYELHVRGYTMRHPAIAQGLRGTLAGLSHPEVIRHLRDLNITAIELLPIHPIGTPRRLWEIGLRDYWGYNSLNFFAIEPRYLSNGNVAEFKRMVRSFHDAGIEVILDIVFNHSGEGDELGPTLSFRGIDNASYYCLHEDKRHYIDLTGCQNTLNVGHPRVAQMVMDSLRYWVQEMHVDGFRFDLAVSLARQHNHFSSDAPFLGLMMQDPALAKVKLIAEPWDLGVDGYQLGSFPPGWKEWNDKFRDTVRRFWRGDGGFLGSLAYRLTGSSDVFSRSGRGPMASVNYVTAHDGFTLEDLVSYTAKRNDANGENNVDGSEENFSSNYGGPEGTTNDPAIKAMRAQQRRNIMATLLFSQGVPMILGGDEIGRTQKGNNNAYCQDNETSWVDWEGVDTDKGFLAFARHLLELHNKYSIFRRSDFFRGSPIGDGHLKDVIWLAPGGQEMTETDWNAPDGRCLGIRYGAIAEDSLEGNDENSFLLLLNAADAPLEFSLPDPKPGAPWRCVIDTALMDELLDAPPVEGSKFALKARSLVLFASAKAG